MLYSQTDLSFNRTRLKREAAIMVLCALAFLVLAIVAFIARIEPLCIAAALLCGSSAIFLAELRVMPLFRYDRFLTELHTGLSHETRGMLLRVGEDALYENGVLVRECILDIHAPAPKETERRFLLDAAKQIPQELVGREVTLTSHDLFVLDVTPAAV